MIVSKSKGVIFMTVSNLEKEQAKLEKLNEKIKQEKKKIDQRLGHEIIKNAKLDYNNLDQVIIKELSSKIVNYLNENSIAKSNDSDSKQSSKQDAEFNQTQG